MRDCTHETFNDAPMVFADGSMHIRRSCASCSKFIKFVSKPLTENAAEVVMEFGKYAGKSIAQLHKTDPGYLFWLAEKGSGKFKKAAIVYLNQIDDGR